MPKPIQVPDLLDRKARGQKITMLTAYDATMARLMDRAEIDVLLWAIRWEWWSWGRATRSA
jgi:Ketopantoate hydroxymethyltransferase